MNNFKRRMIAISLSTTMAISMISAMSIYADDAEHKLPTLESGRLLGDVSNDGKFSTADVGLANSHAKSVRLLADEDFKAADINNDGKITTADVGRINSHVKGVQLLDGTIVSPTDPSNPTEPSNPPIDDGELDFERGKAYFLNRYEEIRTMCQNCLDNLPSEEEAKSTIVIDNVETLVYPSIYNIDRSSLIENLTNAIDYIDNKLIPNVDADIKKYLSYNEIYESYKGMTDIEVIESELDGDFWQVQRYYINEDGTIPTYIDFYPVMDNPALESASANCELGKKGKAWVEAIRAENLTNLEIIQRANEYAIELYEKACGKLTEKATYDNMRIVDTINEVQIAGHPEEPKKSTVWEFIEYPEEYLNMKDYFEIVDENDNYFCTGKMPVVSLPGVVSALVEPLGIDLYCPVNSGGCDALVYWDEETQTRYYTNVVLNAYYSSGLYGADDMNTYTNLTDPYEMSVNFCEFSKDVATSIPKTSLGREVKRCTRYSKTLKPFNKYCFPNYWS